jgi:hypothetical protein
MDGELGSDAEMLISTVDTPHRPVSTRLCSIIVGPAREHNAAN